MFGEREELVSIGQERAKKYKNGVLYGRKEGGGSSVLYVLPYGRQFEGFPENPKPRSGMLGSRYRGKNPTLAGIPGAGVMALGSVALGLTKLAERKDKVRREEEE
jgi:hypothetical protein